MIQITHELSIGEDEIQVDFVLASGPGGQNVNKIASRAQLRFNINTPSLPEDIRARLAHIARNRITQEGILIIDAHRYRTQERNRQDAIQRLIALLSEAAQKPKTRHKTRPTLASQQRRLEVKRRRSEIKRLRRENDSG